MTEVLFDLTKPTRPGLNAPAAGYLECRPTLRRTVDASIVLPDKFDVRLVDGIATADLAPTIDGTWAWEIVERANRGKRRLVSVPASGPVNYADLDDVDPTTLDPTTPVVPAYKALIDAVDEKADEAKTAADGAVELAQSASTAAGAAVDAAGQVADDLAEFDASLDGKVGADVATPGTATEAAVAAKIATLSALVVDLAGNPLGDGHVVIKVDTENGNEIDDIVWVEAL